MHKFYVCNRQFLKTNKVCKTILLTLLLVVDFFVANRIKYVNNNKKIKKNCTMD